MAAITGLGVVTSLGRGAQRLWAAMADGLDGIAPVRRFETASFGGPLAGSIPDLQAEPAVHLCQAIALEAANEAWAHARLDGVPRERIALVFGSSLGDASIRVHEITEALGDALDIRGPRLSVSTACASSTNALGIALDLLALGSADVVIAGGSDVLSPLVLAGFQALGVLSAGKCAPFSEPPGTTLGEGAGFVVLERDAARMPAAHAVIGYGLAADAFHDTGPDPTGAGVARAIASALTHAGVATGTIDYVNVHGTGTRANDPAEWRALRHVLGPRAEAIPISSSKSFLAHAQGAAGVCELAATLLALDHGMIPPTQHHAGARPNSPPDVVAQATPRPGAVRTLLKSSAGFGGANCSLVVAREGVEPARVRRPIYVAGLAERATERVLAGIDPNELDAMTRYLTGAVAAAFADAKLKPRGVARGLVAGIRRISLESDRGLQKTIDDHGLRGLSANLFARQVVNAPAGTCARLLELRGVHSTVAAADATELFAVVYAAELLATRSEIDAIAAASVDEEAGAACVVATAAPSAVRLAGWGIAGPGDERGALHAALAMAGVADTNPAADVVAGVQAIRGGASHVSIVHGGGSSAACALVLSGGSDVS